MTRGRILVAGAGLGGLAAALALLDRGFSVEVHEQAPALGEVGAGLTLSRGVQHVLRDMRLMDEVAKLACAAVRFPFLHYRSGELLTGVLDHGDGAPDDGSADVSRQLHRADLHGVFARAFRARAPGQAATPSSRTVHHCAAHLVCAPARERVLGIEHRLIPAESADMFADPTSVLAQLDAIGIGAYSTGLPIACAETE